MTRIRAAVLLAVLAATACSGGNEKPSGPAPSADVDCVDRDGDGYGEGCSLGDDCDDRNAKETKQCLRCATPNTDCPCEIGSQPITCYLDKTEADNGTIMCNEGTRYCRDSQWSACENVHTYPLPPERAEATALIPTDGGPVQCNDCSVNCFRVSDNLDPVDGGLNANNSNQTSFVPGGGLTLSHIPQDAGVVEPPPTPVDCMPGTAPDIDCDGIPDIYDPFPNDPPFATANPGIFLDIGPGETGTGVIDLDFFINSADVYFLVDQSASMSDERDRLKADLVSGDFINDPNYNCADVNLNHIADDNGLKTQGIVGAINCIIRDANFGAGFHREIPFTDYADNKQIAFDSYQDITSDRMKVVDAIGRLDTIGNIDWPEASMIALNSLVTGNGQYFGTTKRGIPPRIDCPAGTWGYPCFRDSAIPIVILFTDAMMHNGPDNNNYPYASSKLGLTRGTEMQYFPLASTNEAFGTSYNAGDVTSVVRTFTGDTSLMTSSIDRTTLSCLSQDGGPDAFVRFDLAQSRTVRISSEGTRFDTVLGLYAGQPQAPVVLPASSNTNETAASATDLGPITGGSVQISGNTSAMQAHYDWSTVRCNADPASRDAVYRFDVTAPTNVEINTVGSSFDTVVSLHNGVPPTAPTYTNSPTTIETLETAESIGAAYNAVLARQGSTTGRTANYLGAEVGCGADNTSPDVVHKFTLAQPTRVRISNEGSSFDTVMALVGDTCGGAASTPPPETDTGGSNAVSNASRTFVSGSVVIPMDTAYQNAAMLRAYGLVYTLLLNDIPVSWVIKKSKTSGEADFSVASQDFSTSVSNGTVSYRGGPFVIDSTDVARATPFINTFLVTNPTVAVHRTTANFDGYVRRQLTGAPRFALMRDGSEATARSYLAAAGINDSAGTAWPDATSPDVKTLAQLAGASTSAYDGALFDGAGTPAYCGLISAGWSVAGASTSQGVEVVRETRQFLESATSLFAQNDSPAAFENGTGGRLLTLAGYNTAATPSALFELNVDSPYAQIHGNFTATGAFALPSLDQYRDNDATIYGKGDGSSGEADVWVTARLDGECSILDEACASGQALGRISYLAGGAYSTTTPVTLNAQANGVRLFLNSLFAADCATKEQRPLPTVFLTGPSATAAASNTYSITYNNDGEGYAHGATLEYTIPTGATFVSATGGGALSGGVVRWSLGSLAPDEAGTVSVTVSYGAYGTFSNQAALRFAHGNTSRTSLSWVITTAYSMAGAIGCTALGVNQVVVPSTNENQSSPYDMSDLKGRVFRLTGSTSGMQPNYSAAETGTCGAASDSPDAVYKFHLSQAADVTISTEGTTGWDSVLSLYNGNISPTTDVAATNAGEATSSAQALGSINNKRIALTGATTATMAANYDLADIGCTAEPTSADAVYSFSVSTVPTTVRMTTAGSGFDTVMSLHSNDIVSVAPITTTISNTNNWLYSNAYQVPLPVNGRDQVFLGNTSGLTADIILPQTNCMSTALATGKDAVFQFTVGATASYEIDTTGSSFDTVVALYDSNPQFTGMNNTFTVPEGEDEVTSGFNLGSVYRSNVAVRGETSNNNSLTTRTDCNAFGSFFGFSQGEAALRFSIPASVGSRNITIDTAGSDFDTVIHLYKISAGSLSYQNACNDNATAGVATSRLVTAPLSAGDYVVMISSTGLFEEGNYQIRVQDSSAVLPPNTDVRSCNDTAGGGSTRARIPAITLTAGQTYYVVVKGFNASAEGAYQLQIRDNTLPTTGTSNRVTCNDDFGTSPQAEITWPITTAGTYYVVVKGGAVGAQGPYSLLIEDVTNPPVGAVLECDDNDGPGGSSMIRRTSLAAGDYWVVLKGKTMAASGAYTLRVLDEGAAVGTILECNDDGGLDNAALIERDLAPGTYYVITKGDNAAEAGNYKLTVRDVTNQKLNHLTCDDDGAAAQTSRINADLTPGTYYAVVKGDAASNSGAYTLTVQDTANSPLGAIACNDDGGTYKTSVISQTLNAGTYYVGLKGYNANEKGDYQLTIGGGTTSSGTYVPPTWAQTRDALIARGAKVLPILSCQDDPDHGNAQGDCNRLRTQAVSLANATSTLGSNLQPLYFDINRNGAGLSKTVVDGIASLAEYLEMDVRVIVKFDPDANPGFLVNIVAIDEIGDGCSGIVGTEHQACAPGATPRFNIEITNPLPGVPPHPTDPNGGYTFRAQLIGDDQFIVEEVPIYIIPESLTPMGPQEPPVYEEGTYWQDTTSPGCTSENQTPDWADLSWVADVYRNTTIEFIACTSATQAALDTCTPVEVAEITGAGDCVADSDCPVGYCDTDIGVCQITLGGPCTLDSQCADNAFCDEAIERCMYTSQPVYVGEQLSNSNFQRYIRMRINMRVTEPFEDPPVLHSWEMTYYCTNNL